MIRRTSTILAIASVVVVAACDQLATSPSHYAAVEVQATRRDGTPVPAVPLTLLTGLRVMGYATTDAHGNARFDRVPEGPAYGVLAGIPAGYARVESLLGGGNSDFVFFALHRDSLPVARFRFLKIGPGTATVRVVDQASAPLSGIDVDLYSPTQVISRQKTGTDGRATFSPVPFGNYGVRALRPEAYRDLGEQWTLDVDGLVMEDGVTETRTLALQRCVGSITLTVSNPTFGPGVNIRTQLFNATEGVDAKRTGADGTVRYTDLRCDDYGVRVLPSENWVLIPGRGTEFDDNLHVRRGTALTSSLPGQYNTCRGSLRVTTTDPLGTAVPGVAVALYSSFEDPIVTRATSSTGTVTFDGLGCGPNGPGRAVFITAPSGWTATPGRGGTYMDALIVTHGTTVDVRFTLTRNGT